MKAENKIQPEGILEQDVELFSHKDISEDNILFEDVKKRDERTKHFRTKDGKYIAATFRNPIHVLDESTGEYVDIADTFEEKEECFESKNPRYNARFPKEDSEASFVSIEKNGRSVDWHFRSKNSAKKKASVKKKEKHSKLECAAFPTVRYEGNSDDCVLEYKLTESGIKEDIILFSRPEKSEFEFDFKIKGLDAVLADDKKTIKLFANDTESVETEFVLPKIVMFDAAGVYSEDAHYEIEEHGNKLTVKVVASDEWLFSDERVYPVTIDPQVVTYNSFGSANNIRTVGSDNSRTTVTSMYERHISRVGYKNNGIEYRTFVQLDYPELPLASKVTSATLKLYQDAYAGNGDFEVCKVNSAWTYANITWANQPSCSSSVYDTFVGKERATTEAVEIDLTADAKKYYAGTASNHGVVLKASDAAQCVCNNDGDCVYADRYIEFGYSEPPTILVEYVAIDEYADNQQYETFEVGRAGTGSVNLFTGKLHFVHNDISESGGHLPLSLSHIYRSDFKEMYEKDTTFGKGWRLSACQSLEYSFDSRDIFASYIDANGRAHYFDPDQYSINEDGYRAYYDTAGLGFSYIRDINQIVDEKGNKMTFVDDKLSTIEDANGNKITYTYNDNKLTAIEDDMGRTATLIYRSDGKLDKILDSKDKKTIFVYSGDKLIQITYPDGSKTKFDYNDQMGMRKISDYSGIIYRVTYDADNRVSTVKQYGSQIVAHDNCTAKDVLGDNIAFEYRAISTVVKDVTSEIGQVFRFDDKGRVVDSYEYLIDDDDSDQRAEITPTDIRSYEPKLNRNNKKTTGKYVSASAKIDGVDNMYPNYITNGTFETSYDGTVKPTGWTVGTVYSGIDGVVDDAYIEGHKSYKFNNTCCKSNKTIKQTVNLCNLAIDGNMLVASAWAKASAPTNTYASSGSSNAKFELYAKLTFEDGSYVEETKLYDCGCTEWQYVAIPLAMESLNHPPVSALVQFNFSGNTGTCLVSNIRLTKVRANYSHMNPSNTRLNESFLGETQTIIRQNVQTDWKKVTYTYLNDKMDAVKTTVFLAEGSGFTSLTLYDDKHRPIKTRDYRDIVTECQYDSFGNVTEEKIYHNDTPDVYLISKVDYDSLGRIKKEYDSRNDDYVTNYSYTSPYGLLANKTDPNDQKYTYGYDDNNKRQTTVNAINAYCDICNITNTFEYDYNQMTQVKHNDFIYDFEYEPLGRNKSVKAEGNTLVSFAYLDAKYSKTTASYANGYTSVVEYDKFGNPTKKTINGNTISTANYDSRGNIFKLVDNLKGVCYDYSYDGNGNLIRVNEKEGSSLVDYKSFTYDNQNRPLTRYENSTEFTYETIYEKKSTGYIYPDDAVKGVKLRNKFTDEIEKDKLRRTSVHKLTLNSASSPLISESYSYLDGTDGRTTEFVSSIAQTIGSKSYNLAYTYDEMGNVKTVKDTNDSKITYTYDGLNQLIKECDNLHSRKVRYTYDKGGNIISKKVYSLGATTSFVKEYKYSYASDWKDKLVSFDGETIEYDEIGNPTTYRGNDLTWTNVRRLATFGNNTYEYGADGIRTSKTANGVKHNYTLNGNKIIKETFGSNTVKYFYGASGVVGLDHNGTDYYYRKNLQGDILAIVDASGSVVAQYDYDAWGYILAVKDGNGVDVSDNRAHIANINPFRYRGYYYDTETGLYYLNSRYYDPETGRFINADSLEYLGVNGDFVNYNLFVYCGNNSVMNKDPDGELFLTAIIIGTIAGVAIGFGATVYADYADDGEVFNGSIEAKGYIINTLVCGTIGAGVGIVAPYMPGIIASSVTISIPTSLAYASGGASAIAITVTGAHVLGILSVIGLGIMFAKPNSGRIRYSDGTGIDPNTGKEFSDPNKARDYYKSIKDPAKKNKWKKWLKGKGWYHNHLK